MNDTPPILSMLQQSTEDAVPAKNNSPPSIYRNHVSSSPSSSPSHHPSYSARVVINPHMSPLLLSRRMDSPPPPCKQDKTLATEEDEWKQQLLLKDRELFALKQLLQDRDRQVLGLQTNIERQSKVIRSVWPVQESMKRVCFQGVI